MPPDIIPAEEVNADPEEAVVPDENLGWYYCLNENHPGAPNYQSEPLNLARQFQASVEDLVPVCPACGYAGNSLAQTGEDQIPEFVIQSQERFGR